MASRNRGVKKTSVRDLSRVAPTDEEAKILRRQASDLKAAPIVTAILGGALLDHELEVMLRDRFRCRDKDAWDELTGERGPLDSFSRKIIAAHAFGFFDDVIRDGLDIVRAIRNAFAHSKVPLDFDNPVILKSLKNVKLPEKKKSDLYKSLESVTQAKQGGQCAYILLCLILSNHLMKKQKATLRSKTQRLKKTKKPSGLFTQFPFAAGLAAALTSQPLGSPSLLTDGLGALSNPPAGRTSDQSAGPLGPMHNNTLAILAEWHRRQGK